MLGAAVLLFASASPNAFAEPWYKKVARKITQKDNPPKAEVPEKIAEPIEPAAAAVQPPRPVRPPEAAELKPVFRGEDAAESEDKEEAASKPGDISEEFNRRQFPIPPQPVQQPVKNPPTPDQYSLPKDPAS